MKNTTKLTSAMLALGFIGSANAATISAVGNVINDSGSEVTEWRTSTTAKSFDVDGDDIYGTFGGIQFGTAVVGGMGFVGSQPQTTTGNAFYAVIDNISGGADVQVQTTTNNGVAGANQDMYFFSVNTAVSIGDVMRVGIGIDGIGVPGALDFGPATIGLREVGGAAGSAEVTVVGSNGSMDMYFFDVFGGITVGTQFAVFADSGLDDYVTHQLVSLDVAAVPEPSTYALIAGMLGLTSVMIRRRR